MSSSDITTEESRALSSTDRRNTIGMLRLMVIRVTSKSFWQGVGVLLIDGVTKEVRAAPVFSGIGFYARPKQGSNAEGVMASVGGPENPVWIATRDEDTRKRVAVIDQDETMTFNTGACLHIKKNATIEMRSVAGSAQSTVKGQTYRTAEDTLLTALGTFATAIGGLNPLTGPAAAVTLNAAITTFKAAAASYLTTVAKVE